MVTEKLKQLALKKEIQVLLVFGVVVSATYYFYLLKEKKNKEAALKGQ